MGAVAGGEGMIYLASPYSHLDPAIMEQRFHTVCAIAAAMMAGGAHVFSPIAHTHPIAVKGMLPRGWEFWDAFDRHFIAHCEKVIVVKMEGWESSKGVAAEIKIAAELGKPVEYMEARQ